MRVHFSRMYQEKQSRAKHQAKNQMRFRAYQSTFITSGKNVLRKGVHAPQASGEKKATEQRSSGLKRRAKGNQTSALR